MIKYLWLFCLIPTLLYGAAGDVASVSGKAVTAISTISGVAGASIATLCGKSYSDGDATCNTATNEVGDRTLEATDRSLSQNLLYMFASTADCTGDLAIPYLYFAGASGDSVTVRLCIYSKSDTTPQEADALICDSGDIVGGGDTEWKAGTTCASGSVTNTTGYWVGVQTRSSTNPWTAKRAGTATLYYTSRSSTSCAATLTGLTFSTSASNAPLSAYFQIGD